MLVRHDLLLEFPPLMTGEQRLTFFYDKGHQLVLVALALFTAADVSLQSQPLRKYRH